MSGTLVEGRGLALVIAAIVSPSCWPLGAPQVTVPSLWGLTALSGQAGVVADWQPPSIVPLWGPSLGYTWARVRRMSGSGVSDKETGKFSE